MPLADWLQLSLTDGLGPILTHRLVRAAGSAAIACGADVGLLQQVDGIGTAKAQKIFRALRDAAALVPTELDRAAKAGAKLICPDDAIYPLMLRSIIDPPCVLYLRGDLEDRDLNGIAIVGSRKCTLYGREQADRFGALLAGAGFTVISGGARGVDSAAHRGALRHPNGRTLAVMGSGIDVIYPPENAHLFEEIAQRGAVLSEFAMGTPPLADNFPRRNRVVSGLSRGVLVVEADQRSGALITARMAVEDHGRPVFAIPGRIDNSQSAGPHRLIREGATLTSGLEDIVDGLGPLPAEASSQPFDALVMETPPAPQQSSLFPPPGLSDRQRIILDTLGEEAMSVDAIIEQTRLDAGVVLQELTFLTLKGVIKRLDGQTFARR